MKNHFWIVAACLSSTAWAMAEPLPSSTPIRLDAQLQEAIGRNQTIKAMALLRGGADPNAQKGALFRWAISLNNELLVREFLQRGAKISPQALESALHVEGDGVRMTTILLNRGASPNAVVSFQPRDDEGDKDGEASPHTILMVAAEQGKTAAAKLLIARGANVHARLGGFSALQIAALQGNVALCRFLLDHRAEVAGAQEPLLRAAVGSNDLAFFDRLQKIGALPRPMRWPLYVDTLSLPMARKLIAAGANPNGDGSFSPLWTAVFQKNEPLARFLLDKGARINADILSQTVDETFVSPLQRKQQEERQRQAYEAAKRDDPFFDESDYKPGVAPAKPEDNRLLKLFLEHGADVNATLDSRRYKGQTALHIAARSNRVEAMRQLLEHGARLEARDERGQTPLFAALIGQSDLTFAALLEAGANIEARDDQGATPLLYAIGTGGSVTFYAPLSVAAEPDGSSAFAQTLIARGANIKATSNNGATPLHVAAAKGKLTFVQLLIERGAVLDAPDQQGRTPLAFACRMGQFETAKWLLEHGANPDQPNSTGQTPRQIVAQSFTMQFERHGAGRPSPYEKREEAQIVASVSAPINAGRRKIAALLAQIKPNPKP